MDKKTVEAVDLTNRTVLMRVDFNVPLRAGQIVSDRRIVLAMPTIRLALEKGAKLVLMSHLGRPAGSGFEKLFSMRPVAERLGTLLGLSVQLGPREVVGKELDAAVTRMKSGDVLLMENLRFHPDEEMGSAPFARTIRRIDCRARRCICQRCVWDMSPRAREHVRCSKGHDIARASRGCRFTCEE